MVPMHKRQAMVAAQPRGTPRVPPLWNELADPDVRALAALIASPLLIAEGAAPIAILTDAWRVESLRLRHQWLLDLDAAPQRLREHLAASNARQLGRYAEALWRFWFAHLPGARLHAAGLPVKDALAVRGEFDFIVSLPGLAEVQHLEMAYKFYLYSPPGMTFRACSDPMPPTGSTGNGSTCSTCNYRCRRPRSAARRCRSDVGQVIPRACLQGWLFYPLATGSAAPIAGVSPAHWRGWWCRSNDWRSHGAPWTELAGAWTLLPRRAWIAPAAIDDPEAMLSPEACRARIDAHFAASSQAQLVAGLERASDGHLAGDGPHIRRGAALAAGQRRGVTATPLSGDSRNLCTTLHCGWNSTCVPGHLAAFLEAARLDAARVGRQRARMPALRHPAGSGLARPRVLLRGVRRRSGVPAPPRDAAFQDLFHSDRTDDCGQARRQAAGRAARQGLGRSP